MSLRDRLRKLEGGLPDGCAHCIAWGPRVLYVNDPEMAEAQPPAVLERCPKCGRESLTIQVIYEDQQPNAVA